MTSGGTRCRATDRLISAAATRAATMASPAGCSATATAASSRHGIEYRGTTITTCSSGHRCTRASRSYCDRLAPCCDRQTGRQETSGAAATSRTIATATATADGQILQHTAGCSRECPGTCKGVDSISADVCDRAASASNAAVHAEKRHRHARQSANLRAPRNGGQHHKCADQKARRGGKNGKETSHRFASYWWANTV